MEQAGSEGSMQKSKKEGKQRRRNNANMQVRKQSRIEASRRARRKGKKKMNANIQVSKQARKETGKQVFREVSM